MMNDDDIRSSPKARGQRVSSLRGMTRLSRDALANKYPIPPRTLQNWELGSTTGLTESGARKLIAAAKAEGIHCSFEWLMYGMGEGPYFLRQTQTVIYDIPAVIGYEGDFAALATEITALLHRNFQEHGIDLTIKDDGMGPYYNLGDYVAGKKLYKQDINTLLDKDCIVQTLEGDILLRRLKKSEKPGCYTLACTNPQTTILKPTLYDVEIVSAAPIFLALRKS